jgi:hypothetical protein
MLPEQRAANSPKMHRQGSLLEEKPREWDGMMQVLVSVSALVFPSPPPDLLPGVAVVAGRAVQAQVVTRDEAAQAKGSQHPRHAVKHACARRAPAPQHRNE